MLWVRPQEAGLAVLPTHPKYCSNGMVREPQRRGAACNSPRQASLNSRKGSIPLINGQVCKFPVRGKVGVDNEPTRFLSRFDDFVAREDFHASYKSEQVDELRNLGFVADECIGIKP